MIFPFVIEQLHNVIRQSMLQLGNQCYKLTIKCYSFLPPQGTILRVQYEIYCTTVKQSNVDIFASTSYRTILSVI